MTNSDELEELADDYISDNGDWDSWEDGYRTVFTLKLPNGNKKHFHLEDNSVTEIEDQAIHFMIEHFREWLLENDDGNG